MNRHSFVFGTFDGQTIGVMFVRFRLAWRGKLFGRGGSRLRAKQSSSEKVETRYHQAAFFVAAILERVDLVNSECFTGGVPSISFDKSLVISARLFGPNSIENRCTLMSFPILEIG